MDEQRSTLQPADELQPTPQRQRQKLLNAFRVIVHSSQDVLYATRTVFPLDLFPDSVTVDRTQVTITHRNFFFMGDVISIRIEDILSVTAHTGPFFGSVQMSTRFYHSDKLYHINWLWRSQALKLKAIIQGLVVATSKEVDLTQFSRPLLVTELMRLGESALNEAP